MAKYRKKPVIIEASQWFRKFDHPKVLDYHTLGSDKERECAVCHKKMREHGSVDTLEGEHVVCPGDWIITGVKGEHYPCKPDVFEQTYDAVKEYKSAADRPWYATRYE